MNDSDPDSCCGCPRRARLIVVSVRRRLHQAVVGVEGEHLARLADVSNVLLSGVVEGELFCELIMATDKGLNLFDGVNCSVFCVLLLCCVLGRERHLLFSCWLWLLLHSSLLMSDMTVLLLSTRRALAYFCVNAERLRTRSRSVLSSSLLLLIIGADVLRKRLNILQNTHLTHFTHLQAAKFKVSCYVNQGWRRVLECE